MKYHFLIFENWKVITLLIKDSVKVSNKKGQHNVAVKNPDDYAVFIKREKSATPLTNLIVDNKHVLTYQSIKRLNR